MTIRSASRFAGRLSGRRIRCRTSRVEALRILLTAGDRTRVGRMLRGSVFLLVDGGGRIIAPTAPVQGRDEVSRILTDMLGPESGWSSSIVQVNGAPAVVFHDGGRVAAILNVRMRMRRVSGMWAVLNPDKLRHWNPR